jgi:uncharacterized protein with von Willebrand factor type A (vWA) domain
MALYDNTHYPTKEQRQRVTDLAVAGIPKYLIAKIIKIDDETLTKHYEHELSCAQAEAVERIGKVVAIQALEGNEKSQALYLKTQGAKFGWVEKQVIETNNADETKELKEKLKELESQHERDY